MDKIKNYNEYDSLVLYVKDNKTKLIIEEYRNLGWELVSSVSNNRYKNIMNLTFVRPHVIENKDELKLLQVDIESTLNKMGRLEKNKCRGVIVVGLSLLVLGVALTALSILQLFNSCSMLDKVLGVSLLIGAIITFTFMYYIVPIIYRADIMKFEAKYLEIKSTLATVHQRIKDVRGVKYGD